MDISSIYCKGFIITVTWYFKIFLDSYSIWKFFFATLALDGKSHFSWSGSFCLRMKWKLSVNPK